MSFSGNGGMGMGGGMGGGMANLRFLQAQNQLQTFARMTGGMSFAPLFATELESIKVSQVTLELPWSFADGEELRPGPVGEYLEVVDYDAHDQLIALAFEGGQLWLPYRHERVGQRLRCRIGARDVVLTRTAQEGTSALNQTFLDIRFATTPIT